MPGGALEGLRVIELGQMVSAPYCAKLFADYGADVIKVEPPAGDIARRWGPFPQDEPHSEKSGLYFFLNTNKRGITLDVGTRAGRDMLLDPDVPQVRQPVALRVPLAKRPVEEGLQGAHAVLDAFSRQPVVTPGGHAIFVGPPGPRLEIGDELAYRWLTEILDESCPAGPD